MDNICSNSRPLGGIESVQYALDKYCLIPRNVVLVITFNKNTKNYQIINLVKHLYQRFIALRLIIKEETSPFFITQDPKPDFPVEVISCLEDVFKLHVEDSLNHKFDVSDQMWHAKCIQMELSIKLVLNFHHSIFDGVSIIKIINEINNTKYIFTSKISERHDSLNQCHYLYPAIDTGGFSQESPPYFDSIRHDHILKSWSEFKTCFIANQRSRSKKIDIEFLQVDKLRLYCQQNKISITSILAAIMIKAINRSSPYQKELLIHTPVDLSKYSHHECHRHEIGCFITIVKTLVESKDSHKIIDIAKNYYHSLKQYNNNFPLVSTNAFSELSKYLSSLFTESTVRFHGGFAISNIGYVDVENNPITTIEDIYFSPSIAGGLGIFVMAVLASNNRFSITVNYTTPLICQRWIEVFINHFIELTLELWLKIDLRDINAI